MINFLWGMLAGVVLHAAVIIIAVVLAARVDDDAEGEGTRFSESDGITEA